MATLLKRKQDTNVGEMERWISLVAGAGLVAYGISRRDTGGLGWAAVGSGLAWRGASGHCNVYSALGIDTRERGYEKGTGSKKGVPYHLGIRIDGAMLAWSFVATMFLILAIGAIAQWRVIALRLDIREQDAAFAGDAVVPAERIFIGGGFGNEGDFQRRRCSRHGSPVLALPDRRCS